MKVSYIRMITVMARLIHLWALLAFLTSSTCGFRVPSRVAAKLQRSVYSSTKIMEKKGSAAVASTKGQVRVRFLVDTKGQGKRGEVAFVSAALFQNVLSPSHAAERISDEAWDKECKDREASLKAEVAQLSALAVRIRDQPIVEIKKKIGEADKEGKSKIFGALTRKALLEQVKAAFPLEPLGKMTVIDIHVLSPSGDPEGLGIEGDDIRFAGMYVAKLNLGNAHVEPALYRFAIITDK